jgi:phage terminase small subunit
MAGQPGKSGGARPGSGRKPAAPVKLSIPVPVTETLAHKDPKVFLMALMNDLEADIKIRADAAKSLMPFMHPKVEAGVKDAKADAAKKAGSGKFGAAAPPKLIVNNR